MSAGGQGAAAVLAGVADALIERFGGDTGDIAAARAEYDERRGRVFEDEDLWETWSQAFVEWYVAERVRPGQEYPPAVLALPDEPDERRRAAIRALVTSQRSLFEIRALSGGKVEVFDLLGGAAFAVAEKRTLHGVSLGDVAEVRVIGFEDEVYFGRTFLYHPSGTRDAIVAHARRMFAAGKDRRDVIDFCASLRVRCERYKHVQARRVYEQGERPPAESAGR
jgi:hypothetical protein